MHLFCAAVRTHRWFAHDQKKKKTFTPSERFSLTCYETNTENITTSNQRQGSYHKEPMRIQTNNKEIAWSAEKREWPSAKKKQTKQKQKPVFSSATIFNRPLLHLTNSLVPKYCERRITLEKRRFPKHISCEEESRVFLEYFMSVTHDVLSGMSYVPCAMVLMPWGRQQLRTQFEYKRAQVTYDGHYRRCLSTEKGTENDLSEVLRVLVM